MSDRNRFFTIEEFPEGGGGHLAAYLSGDAALDGLYAHYPPQAPPGPAGTAGPLPPLSEELARQIGSFNRRAGAAGSSAENLDRLRDEGTRFVIAGQQPGLLTGPPLALYKLITAVRLAGRWQKESGRPVIPLFWIASHDSDRDEIDHVFLPGENGEPNRFRYPLGETEPRAQVGEMRIDREAWGAWLGEIREALPPSACRDDIIERFRALGEGEPTLAELFAASVHQLLPGCGAVLFDGRLAETDPAGRAVMARAAGDPAATLLSLERGCALLEERSIEPPLPAEEGKLPFFLVRGGTRLPAAFEGSAVRPEGEEGVDTDTFAKRILAGEVRVTPSAALRPVVQDAIFPIAATVVGHSELVYHAQLGPLYDRLEVERPPLVPRASLYLLHFRTADKLEKAGLGPRDLLPGREPPEPGGKAADGAIDRFLGEIVRAHGDLLAHLDGRLPGVVPPDDPARSRLEKEARRTADRIGKLVDRATGNRSNLIHRARHELFPGGKPQEHVTSPILFLARYGRDFAARLLEELPAEGGTPRLVIVDPREGS